MRVQLRIDSLVRDRSVVDVAEIAIGQFAEVDQMLNVIVKKRCFSLPNLVEFVFIDQLVGVDGLWFQSEI